MEATENDSPPPSLPPSFKKMIFTSDFLKSCTSEIFFKATNAQSSVFLVPPCSYGSDLLSINTKYSVLVIQEHIRTGNLSKSV